METPLESAENLETNAAEEPAEELYTFTLRKHHIFAGLIPIAFILGIMTGYVFWGEGRGARASSEVQDTASSTRYEVEILPSDPARGPEDAPITMIEFSDYECPYCRSFFDNTLPQLLANYSGQIRYVFKDFPLTSIHPNAFPAAQAALCAHEQNAFWDFHDKLFGMELGLGLEVYQQYASDLGLDEEAFDECLESERYHDEVQADLDFALGLGVRSTPTFFINGIPVIGAQPYQAFVQVIEGELAGGN